MSADAIAPEAWFSAADHCLHRSLRFPSQRFSAAGEVDITWGEATALFLEQQKFSSGTRRVYGGTLRAVEGVLEGCLHVRCLTPATLEGALSTIYGQAQATTWNRTVATVASFLRWCAMSGVLPASSTPPASLPARRKATTSRGRGNSELLACCFDENLPLPDRAIWCLMFDLCLGPEESLQVDIEHVDVLKKAVRVSNSLLFWQPFSDDLIMRVVADRSAGPLFSPTACDRRPPASIALPKT